MRRHSRLRAAALVAKRLLGAVVLGVATILLVKREPDQHWSDPPIITMVEDYDQAARSGAPPGPPGIDRADRLLVHLVGDWDPGFPHEDLSVEKFEAVWRKAREQQCASPS